MSGRFQCGGPGASNHHVSETGTSEEIASPHARDVPLDAHMHTDLSHDSEVPIHVYASLARERRVAEIAITDHLDFDARDPNFKLGEYERRRRIVRDAAERWDGQPHIRLGVEVTYERRLEPLIREYLASHPYDYVIGSVHISERTVLHPSRVESWPDGWTHREAGAGYWDEAEAAIRSGLFDTFGHLDFVKRYLVDPLGPFDYAEHADLYDRLLRALVDTGTALEVNSSGLRQQAREMYPPAAAVERFRDLGGTRVTVGSDAHLAESFGYGLLAAYRSVTDGGFRELSFRRGGERVVVALPDPVTSRAHAPARA